MSFERVTHSKSVENLSGKFCQKEARKLEQSWNQILQLKAVVIAYRWKQASDKGSNHMNTRLHSRIE